MHSLRFKIETTAMLQQIAIESTTRVAYFSQTVQAFELFQKIKDVSLIEARSSIEHSTQKLRNTQ